MKKTSIFDIPDKDERGVSPVIGVILMVAITVILAAVIASFVLGFGSSVSQNVNAGANIEADNGAPGSADVTWISQGNAETLNITVTGNKLNGSYTTQLTDVGQVATLNETNASGNATVNGNTIDLKVDGTNGQDNQFTIVVKAIKGETATVIEKDTVTI